MKTIKIQQNQTKIFDEINLKKDEKLILFLKNRFEMKKLKKQINHTKEPKKNKFIS
jgi:hypothetical protein